MSLNFKYMTDEKYQSLPETEKKTEGNLFMTKGEHGNNIYMNGIQYASTGSVIIINSETDLPVVGESDYIYVTKNGLSYVWDDKNLKYIFFTTQYDVINGGNSNGE